MRCAPITLVLLVACGSQSATPPPVTYGGDRPVKLQVPTTIDPGAHYPLVVVLHGFGASGFVQQAYFAMGMLATTNQAFVLAPDGLTNSAGQFRHFGLWAKANPDLVRRIAPDGHRSSIIARPPVVHGVSDQRGGLGRETAPGTAPGRSILAPLIRLSTAVVPPAVWRRRWHVTGPCNAGYTRKVDVGGYARLARGVGGGHCRAVARWRRVSLYVLHVGHASQDGPPSSGGDGLRERRFGFATVDGPATRQPPGG
jgi:hypothetical protein